MCGHGGRCEALVDYRAFLHKLGTQVAFIAFKEENQINNVVMSLSSSFSLIVRRLEDNECVLHCRIKHLTLKARLQ